MSRAIVPPVAPHHSSPSHQTVLVLEKRLQSAEEDANLLFKQISGVGSTLTNDDPEKLNESGNKELSSVDMLRTNYEGLVSRLCRTESIIQMLKSNVLNSSGDRVFRQEQQSYNHEKLKHFKESHDEDIRKLKCELECVKTELSQETAARSKAEDERRQLKIYVDGLSNLKDEIVAANEELASSNQKFQRKVTDLRDELQREQSLRESLEESHNVMLLRVREIECTVDEARTEVQTLTSDCDTQKIDIVKLKDELKQEQQKRLIAERTYIQAVEDNEQLQKNYDQVDSDEKMLTSELNRMQTQYKDLIRQLEQTQVVNDQQKEMLIIDKITLANHFAQAEADKSRLSEKLALEEEVAKLKIKTQELSRNNETLNTKVLEKEQDIEGLYKKYRRKEAECGTATSSLEKDLISLRQQVTVLKQEKAKTTKDKENLLDEVNQTVDAMTSERTQLQTEINQLRMEMNSQLEVRGRLEQETSNLQQTITRLQQQQEGQKRVETSLKEMVEQKNKYAYDNGHLQATVSQLQSQMEVASSCQAEASHLQKLNGSLQEKYNKAIEANSDRKISVQKLEKEIQRFKNVEESTREKINFAMRTSDELKAENERLHSELLCTEGKSKHKIFDLQKNLDDTKVVNKEIASTLESVMSSHSQLQTVVEDIQQQLGNKDSQISHLKIEKKKEVENLKREMKCSEMKVEALCEELQIEKEKTNKRTNHEVKKQNDNLLTRNLELVKTNTDLRQNASKLENTVQDLKHKLTDNKRKMEYLQQSKKSLQEKLLKSENVRSNIDELDKMKDMYMKKNEDQSERICGFMAQISSLQGELQLLAQAQVATNDLIQRKDQALQRERTIREELMQRYKETKLQVKENAVSKKDADNRLRDAQNESVEISVHLQDAHDWFKTKFDTLQHELVSSKKLQDRLEKENISQRSHLKEERTSAQAAAEKAKEMIKASRKTIGRLADYTKIADQETKQQLTELQKELLKERGHTKYLELKHQQYKDAANCQFESFLNGQ